VKARLLDDLLLADATVGALEVAATRRHRRPLGTTDILVALTAMDQAGDWEWVQLHASPITVEEVRLFHDSDMTPGGQWRNVPLTVDAVQALQVAGRIAEAYQLLPMPPGVLALGLVWRAEAGASRALLHNSELRHRQLLELVQDAVLGTRLMALAVAVGDPLPPQPTQETLPEA
jgi:hypothetical protein